MPTTENSVAIFSYIGHDVKPTAERLGEALAGVESYLYVVEFPSHGVKVGITAKPVQRLAAHARDAAAYGRTVGRIALTLPHENARANEKQLVALNGGRREYFAMGFDEVAAAIKPMTFVRANREYHAAKNAAFLSGMQRFIAGGAL